MARGDVKVFNESKVLLNFGASTTDAASININADSFKVVLITTAYGSVDADGATPTYSDFSAAECSTGGGYTQNTATITVSAAEAGGTVTVSSGQVVWTSAGTGGPADIRTAIIFSDTSTSDLALCAVDMTSDGSAPVDLDDGDVTINSGTLFTFA